MPGPVSPMTSSDDWDRLPRAERPREALLARRAAEPGHFRGVEARARRAAERPERRIAGDDREHRAVLRRRAVEVARGDIAAGTRHVLRHHRRIARQMLANVTRDEPAPQVIAAARPEADDQRDIPAGERLSRRLRAGRCGDDCRCSKREAEPAFCHSRHCLLAAFIFSGCRISFCTRQFKISATYSTFSDGHAISWIQPNCLGCLPDSPSTPSTLPSSESL